MLFHYIQRSAVKKAAALTLCLLLLATALLPTLGAALPDPPELPTYTIEFKNTKDGDKTVLSQKATATLAYTIPNIGITVPEGFELLGWSYAEEEDTIYKTDDKFIYTGTAETVTFYSVWRATDITAVFDPGAEAATGEMADIEVGDTGLLKLPACTYEYRNHHFTGWEIIEGGEDWTEPDEKVYAAGDELTLTANVKIAPVWKKNAQVFWQVIVLPGLAGTESSEGLIHKEYEEGMTVDITAIPCSYQYDGHEFDCWTDGSVFYRTGSEGVVITEDIILTATWKALPASSEASSQTSSATSSKTSSGTSSKTSSKTSSASSSKASSTVSSTVTSSVEQTVGGPLSDPDTGVTLSSDYPQGTQLTVKEITAATETNEHVLKLLNSGNALKAYDVSISGSKAVSGKIAIPVNYGPATADAALIVYHIITDAEYAALGNITESPVFTLGSDGKYYAATSDGGQIECPFETDGFIIKKIGEQVSAAFFKGAFKLENGYYAFYFITECYESDSLASVTADYDSLSPFIVISASIESAAGGEEKGNLVYILIGAAVVFITAGAIIFIVIKSSRESSDKTADSILRSGYVADEYDDSDDSEDSDDLDEPDDPQAAAPSFAHLALDDEEDSEDDDDE